MWGYDIRQDWIILNWEVAVGEGRTTGDGQSMLEIDSMPLWVDQETSYEEQVIDGENVRGIEYWNVVSLFEDCNMPKLWELPVDNGDANGGSCSGKILWILFGDEKSNEKGLFVWQLWYILFMWNKCLLRPSFYFFY